MGQPIHEEVCIQIVYVSSATTLLSREELLELVRGSQESNAALGITGMLLYKEGSFMQVLEGPETRVRRLIRKIQRDPRHSGMLRLLDGEIEVRQFPEWSMGFRDLNTLSHSEAEEFAPYLSSSFVNETFRNEPTTALQLLRSFKRSTS